MTWTPISPTQVQATAPDDEELNTIGYKGNLDDLNERVIDLESGGSGGGGGSVISIQNKDSFWLDPISEGGNSNEGRLWRRRYGVTPEDINQDAGEASHIDLIGSDLGKRRLWFSDPAINSTITTDTNSFRGRYLLLGKGKSLYFKLKKGENFFSIGSYGTTYTDNLEIYIDGTNTPSTLGLLNENFAAAPNSYNAATILGACYGKLLTIMGFDGEEHIIELKNNDSASKNFNFSYLDTGFLSPNYTLTNKVQISNGKLESGNEFTGGEFTFDDTKLNGHCGSLVRKTDGTLYALNGESVACTLVKAGSNIDFPSNPTSLPTIGNFAFPNSGICSISLDTGDHYVFSYTSKISSPINAESLTGIIWNTTHNVSRIANGWENNVPPTGLNSQDFIINYLGTAPLIFSNSNNKIDFSVTSFGVVSSYTATILNGGYSADLMDFNKEFNRAMQAAFPFSGKYFAKYDSVKKLWSIGAMGGSVNEITLISFLFNSGANSSSSIASTLGFASTDLTGKISYQAIIEKNGLSCRPFQRGDLIDYTSPKIRFSQAASGLAYSPSIITTVENFMAWRQTCGVTALTGPQSYMTFIPDKNAVGIELNFEGGNDCQSPIILFVDGKLTTKLSVDYTQNTSAENPINSFTYFVTFPKGTKTISWYCLSGSYSNNNGGLETGFMKFLFLKELFNRPAIEKLNVGDKIIKTFEIAPIQFYENAYFMKGSIYIPQGGNDRIKGWISSGTFTYGNSTGYLGAYSIYTSLVDNYHEINFDIEKDGGGFSFRSNTYSAGGNNQTVNLIKIYLSNSAINESTDLIHSTAAQSKEAVKDTNQFAFIGLKAGNYNVRIKKVNTSGTDYYFYLTSFSLIDSAPDTNIENYVQSSINQRSVPVPINASLAINQKDDENKLSASEYRSFVNPTIYSEEYNLPNEMKDSYTNYANNKTNSTNVGSGIQFGYAISAQGVNAKFSALIMGQELFFIDALTAVYSNSWTSYLNNNAKITMAHGDPIVKTGGTNGHQDINAGFARNRFNFVKSCSFSSGDTFLASNTSDLKPKAQLLLYDGTNWEQVKIISVITNTSFVVTKRSIVIDANVTSFKASGYHSLLIKTNVVQYLSIHQILVTPLPVSYSNYFDYFRKKDTEVSYAIYKSIGTGTTNLGFPVFKDGLRANAKNTSAVVTKISDAATYYSITIGSNISITVTGGGNVDVMLTSIRG